MLRTQALILLAVEPRQHYLSRRTMFLQAVRERGDAKVRVDEARGGFSVGSFALHDGDARCPAGSPVISGHVKMGFNPSSQVGIGHWKSGPQLLVVSPASPCGSPP